jgi:hypothetical protein
MWQNETLKIVRTSRVQLNLKWAVPGPLGIRLASLCTRGAQTGLCNRVAQTRAEHDGRVGRRQPGTRNEDYTEHGTIPAC